MIKTVNVHTNIIYAFIPDFAYEEPVEQEAQSEENQALDDGGDKHPAQRILTERIPISIDTITTQELDFDVISSQLHEPVSKAELGED